MMLPSCAHLRLAWLEGITRTLHTGIRCSRSWPRAHAYPTVASPKADARVHDHKSNNNV